MSPRKRSGDKNNKKSGTKDLPQPPSLTKGKPSLFTVLPNLGPPPTSLDDILTRPPFPEPTPHPHTTTKQPSFVPDDLTSDLLHELRQTDFGSSLKTISYVKRPKIPSDKATKTRFLTAKDAYITAGKKYLELEFPENAAMNFTSAILCVFLGEDVFEAAHLIAKLAADLPPSVTDNYSLQGAKLLLKANLIKSTALLAQAEKWLLKDSERLYREDIELINRALRHSETLISTQD
jgi:hypothetical protein